VPVLVDGDEVIHDSKRILQYLDWRYEKSGAGASTIPGDGDSRDSGGADRRGRGQDP
jgi:glutathione S-transferase